MKKSLNQIKKIFEKGENIIQYLKNGYDSINTDEMIRISYDFQSGTYIQNVKKNPEYIKKYTTALSNVFNGLEVEYESILEVGVGEATTIANLIPKLKVTPKKVYGFDLSWSRVRYGMEYMKKKKINNSFLFMGDIFNIPLADNSIDIVYTSHSIEPNRGREKEALLELMRVTKKYLILLEPAYEFATVEAKKRMNKHGYIKNLYPKALSLRLNVIEHRLFDIYSNKLNPTGIIIIEKDRNYNTIVNNPLICPLTKTPLNRIKGSFFTDMGLVVYPVIDGIPCLLKDYAIIATHYTDNFGEILSETF
jgi:ubiquinone/menaquinone biosynthesis C-methylase UbiE